MLRRRKPGELPVVRQPPTTNPILPVDDLDAAAEFYTRLGLEVYRYDDDYAWVKHSGWEWAHLRRVDRVDGNESGAYWHVANADDWWAAMREASSGEIELPEPQDMPWGQREYVITDPSGNVVRIGSPADGR